MAFPLTRLRLANVQDFIRDEFQAVKVLLMLVVVFMHSAGSQGSVWRLLLRLHLLPGVPLPRAKVY